MSVVNVVDGTFELFRFFFGAPPRQRRDGVEVGATRALVATLLSLLREPQTHVGVAFDTVIESFRNDLFDGYKTGAGIDPNLFGQFPLAEAATRAMGLVTWSMREYECDDALATMAIIAAKDPSVEQVRICSPDKDLTQVVSGNRIVCVDRIRKSTLDEDGVVAKFGVPPSAIADLLALVGDDADGVPGLPGFGMKSAATLLRHYGALEAIPDGLAATLAARRDEALLYKRLTTLVTTVPLTETVEDLRWRGPHEPLLNALAADLDDDSLVERVMKVWREHPLAAH